MKGCETVFATPAQMTMHLDTGSCASGLNRHKINTLAVTYDRNNVITNPSRLLENSIRTMVTTNFYFASALTWNGKSYECYLCHQKFKELPRLNAHLNSPRHDEKMYRCPRSDCLREFTTLSAIMQHVESKCCKAHRFKEVENVWRGLEVGLRSLAL